ncbi:beta-ketoacyl-[acyl-carrier-protein] synthase family protein [Crenobacter sp. SG2305]|uniref:beta-ketoacyl-[acyl-carrier-protein] synthase family protein n=1 Tax=Crenobacter oryzisoli TaxID=3056844 RepID=UPI0025AABD82|nr:beta-ketoacyl-[acyl-carrier-protein] synthase family protein [Crenobacter sp. SG2305]MDN0081916.1 beta-ketoacyl-[acyl-carrier-protein] synthase family protein [Crenobacter sp. SG2305]
MAKVLITGMGAISPLGADLPASFAQALAGHCAAGAATPDIAKWLPNVLLAQAAADPASLLGGKHAGLDRASQFALVAANEAMAAANLAPAPADSRRFGVYVGIGFGGAHTVDSLYERFQSAVQSDGKRNPVVVHPLSVPRMMANAPAAAISMGYGLHGPSQTYSVACASSAIAIGEAFRAIRDGYLDAAVVVGCEAMLTPGALMAWNALRVMAKPHAADPSRSCRPFSQDRSGFVLGEGGAAIVLESETRAVARGQSALAELCGYGSSSDAAHLTAPSSAEQINAMQQALDDAGLRAEDIQYLNAHGTATDAGDVTETESIRGVFGAAASQLAISSTKAMHGHLIGASGILEFALSVMAMNSGSLPPTATLEQADPRCDLDFIPQTARHGCDVRAIMSNSFAFGGSNVSLVARRYPA